MDIFRGKKRSKGRRARQAMRERDSRRRSTLESPLSDLVGEERRVSDRPRARRSKREGQGPRINMSHVVFLLVGLVLGALLFLLLSVLPKLRHAKPEEKAPPAEAAAKAPPVTPALAPAAAVYQATSPADAVRVMLKASLSGDTVAAYGQWDITPDEVATVRGGQAISLAETTALAAEGAGKTHLEDYTFSVKSEEGDEARVLQKRGEVIVQIYSLHRRDGVWRIRYASAP